MSFSLPVFVEAAARASVILALTGLVAAALRRSSASARHLVWVLGLTSALLVPALAIVLPKVEVPIVRIASDAPAVVSVTAPPVAENRVVEADRDLPAEAGDLPAKAGSYLQITAGSYLQITGNNTNDSIRPAVRGDLSVAPGFSSIRPAVRGDLSVAPGFSREIRTLSVNTILLLIWVAGASLVLGRMLLGLLAVQWMSRRTRVVTDGSWLALARGLVADLGLKNVRFVQSATASMPMAWGIFRPSVLMPAAADSWPAHRLRVVLLHELAHVKRRDCLTHLVAQVVCAAYWFNPLAWIAARRLRSERERACDDLVLACGTRGSDYADELLDIARVMHAQRFPAVMAGASLAMAHRSQLEGRLIAILDPSVPRRGLTRARAAAAAAVFAILIVSVASVQPWAEARTPAAAGPDAAPPQTAGVRTNVREESVRQSKRQDTRQTAVQTEGQVHGAIADTVVETAARAGEAFGRTVGNAVGNAVGHTVLAVVDAAAGQGRANPTPTPTPTPHPNPNPHPTPNPNWNADWNEHDQADGKGKADPRAVAALMEALKDTDKDVRETAMHALVQLRDPRIFEPLVAALKDTSPDVREQAAFGLGQLRDPRAVDPLTSVLHDSNADVREQAVFALGQIRSPKSVEPLISALKDEKPDVRGQAAFALGQIRDAKAVEALVIALKDGTPDVREQAAFALGQIRDPRAIDGLTAAMKDANVDVRRQAAFALGQIRY